MLFLLYLISNFPQLLQINIIVFFNHRDFFYTLFEYCNCLLLFLLLQKLCLSLISHLSWHHSTMAFPFSTLLHSHHLLLSFLITHHFNIQYLFTDFAPLQFHLHILIKLTVMKHTIRSILREHLSLLLLAEMSNLRQLDWTFMSLRDNMMSGVDCWSL